MEQARFSNQEAVSLNVEPIKFGKSINVFVFQELHGIKVVVDYVLNFLYQVMIKPHVSVVQILLYTFNHQMYVLSVLSIHSLMEVYVNVSLDINWKMVNVKIYVIQIKYGKIMNVFVLMDLYNISQHVGHVLPTHLYLLISQLVSALILMKYI